MLKDFLKGWLQGVFQGSLISLGVTLVIWLITKIIIGFSGDTEDE